MVSETRNRARRSPCDAAGVELRVRRVRLEKFESDTADKPYEVIDIEYPCEGGISQVRKINATD